MITLQVELLDQFVDDCTRYEETRKQIQKRGAEVVKQIRGELKLSQSRFAGRLGVTRACVCMIENERMVLSSELAGRISEIANEAQKPIQ